MNIIRYGIAKLKLLLLYTHCIAAVGISLLFQIYNIKH